MEFTSFITALSSALSRQLPGENAQWKMAPLQRRALMQAYEAGTLIPRQSAVLIILYPFQHRTYIILTLRPSQFGVHSDQVSFPGGGFESTDVSLEATALREANEEIGVDPSAVKVLGRLTPVYIPVSNYLVHPFIGSALQPPQFSVNEMEVKQLIEMDISLLLDENIKKTGSFLSQGKQEIESPYYEIQKHKIWGATAMILSELEDMLRKITES